MNIVIGLIILLAVGLGFVIARSISGPLAKLKDATARIDKMAEEIERLTEKNKELSAAERNRAKELEHLYKDLKYAQEKLERTEKLAALGQLSTAVAHEMRNPLSVIRTSVYNLKSKISHGNPEISENLEILEKELGRIGKTVIDILDFSRPVELTLEPADVNAQIEDVIDSLRRQALCPENISIDLELKKDLPDIPLDRESMRRVFINIITNALESMPGGGRLKISTDMQDKTLKISFSDTGKGIPEEYLSKLREPFFTTKRKGIGLGFPIACEIVERHKGSIDVMSETNKGTTFTINLPGGKS